MYNLTPEPNGDQNHTKSHVTRLNKSVHKHFYLFSNIIILYIIYLKN